MDELSGKAEGRAGPKGKTLQLLVFTSKDEYRKAGQEQAGCLSLPEKPQAGPEHSPQQGLREGHRMWRIRDPAEF